MAPRNEVCEGYDLVMSEQDTVNQIIRWIKEQQIIDIQAEKDARSHLIWLLQSTCKYWKVYIDWDSLPPLKITNDTTGYLPLVHSGCGKTAFYVIDTIFRTDGRAFLSQDAKYLYGPGPSPGDEIMCQACFGKVKISDFQDFFQKGKYR